MRAAHPQPQPGRTRGIIQHGRLAWGFAALNRAAMRSRGAGRCRAHSGHCRRCRARFGQHGRCRARFGHHGRCQARFGRPEPPRWHIIARNRIECPNVARKRRQCPYVARRCRQHLECTRKRHGATRSHQTRANARASTRAAPACSKLARAARSVAPVVMTSSSKRRRLPATGSTTSYKPCACFWRSERPRAR